MASPYINNALDGTDRGANVATVMYYNGFVNSGDRRTLSIPRPVGSLSYLGVSRADYPAVYMQFDYFPAYTRLVNVNSNTTLNNAIQNAIPGDRIVVDDSVVYTVNVTAPVINGDSTPGTNNVVTLISKAIHDSMPGGTGLATVLPQKVRIAGPADYGDLVRWKNVSTANEPTLRFLGPTKGWRIVGFRFDVDPLSFIFQRLLQIGNGDNAVQTNASLCPSNIITERCAFTGHSALEIRHVVEAHAKYVGLLDCWFDDELHDYADAQCFYSANGPGPNAVINNRLNEMSMAFIFGGAPTVCGAPANNEIKLNLCTRPLKWNNTHPTYDSSSWQIKCGGEIKKAQNTDIAYNEIRYNWPSAQDGFALLIKDETYGDAGQGHTQNVLIRHNLITHAPAGINFAGVSGTPIKRVVSYGNLGININAQYFVGSSGKFIGTGTSEDLAVIHDTWVPSGTTNAIIFTDAILTRLTLLDNIFGPTSYGIKGSSVGSGTAALNMYAPGWDVRKNVFVSVDVPAYPPLNDFESSLTGVQFTNLGGGDFTLLGSTQIADGSSGGGGGTNPQSPVIGVITATGPRASTALTGTAQAIGAFEATLGPASVSINTPGPLYFEGSFDATLGGGHVIIIGEVDPVIGAITAQAAQPNVALAGTQTLPPDVIPDPDGEVIVTVSTSDETPVVPVVTDDSIAIVT